GLRPVQCKVDGFDHGHAGLVWANKEYMTDLENDEAWDILAPWFEAVAGHHGDFPDQASDGVDKVKVDQRIMVHDRAARHSFIEALAEQLLHPVGLSLQTLPPVCSVPARNLLAGFCAVCDWVGSNNEFFLYASPGPALGDYLQNRLEMIRQQNLLKRFGLLASTKPYTGLQALLKAGDMPRSVQREIDKLPMQAGLTLIEAPTGCGKTEAALAYAWRLLEAGMADSLLFALPTQATANAMLKRLEAFADKAFGDASVVLAHGKSRLNDDFQKLIEAGKPTAQGDSEAAIQCAAWLASSRKRVFLGQIGVCTIDQVLLSVLPVRHKFVRGFGVAKSVLIVDEVHAYDAYMYGLLGEVLRQQKANGGSALLLSATLPSGLRAKLLETWGAAVGAGDQAEAGTAEKVPYPALWGASQGSVSLRTVVDDQQPRDVGMECLKLTDAQPDAALISRIIQAAEAGAQVAIVMNLVKSAQELARALRSKTEVPVDVFHARYRFADRQQKEAAAIGHYGREGARQTGRILVATQVVEQSLDLDFDWLLTQICPVDLLFQRLGRLHRHKRVRPAGFEKPRATVLSVAGDNYGLHKLIYGNTRVLWRTEQLLAKESSISFPDVYREWIERVYERDAWENEPDVVYGDYLSWKDCQKGREKKAERLTTMTVKAFQHVDDNLIGYTRDGEMSLNVLPILANGRLLDGQSLDALTKRERAEAINLNGVPAPASWEKLLHDCPIDSDGPLAGYWQLQMQPDGEGRWSTLKGNFYYSEELGLEESPGKEAPT
ncbi:MAG: CRISPR-associated helicase/endonuclease Cas3, partial [Betaproteobacteria bacterium]|nr:CRISPR-associated helicase/endonuclease Cas3 [Betaproteobacteria bacterium]